jgi:hypothetical protein
MGDESSETDGSEKLKTTSLTRDVTHLDMAKWFMLAGGAAAVRYTALHPLTFVIARERTHRTNDSAIAVVREAYRQDGLRTIMRGVGASAGGNSFGEATYIVVLEYLRHHLPFRSKVTRDAWAGFVADAANVIIAAPFDAIAARQITAGSGLAAKIPYTSAVRMGASMYQQHGMKGLCAGMSGNLAYSPSSAIWWPMYEKCKAFLYETVHGPLLTSCRDTAVMRWVPKALFDEGDNAGLNMIAGVVTSVVVTTLFCPVLVVRTRLQVAYGTMEIPKNQSRIFFICKDLLRNEGWRGFFKGAQANATFSILEGIIFSQLYELSKRFCDVTIED